MSDPRRAASADGRPARERPVVGRDREQLERRLARLDGRGYKAYRELAGRYRFGPLELCIDHVQGDPFAEPSRVRLRLDQRQAAFPAALFDNPDRRRALHDFLLRHAHACARQLEQSSGGGSGCSGEIRVLAPAQEVLERSAVQVDAARVELRLRVGLPAAGRRILGGAARALLVDTLPRLAAAALEYRALDAAALAAQVRAVEDQAVLRRQLRSLGLVAFLGDGAVLPRASGVDPRPLGGAAVVRLVAPESLAREMRLASGTAVRGLAIPEGITVIVGGGFHGKSTLLRALALGIYDHPPGDGRELCVTRDDAVKVRAEDGRAITGVDISAFIGELPGGRQTCSFATPNASGSTSQAAATVEALEAGARLLLVDEDTSATNFMIRDARMRRLVPAASEPIVPFVDRVRALRDALGVSVVLVTGGSGDYLAVADQVIQMESYRPREVTRAARAIAGEAPAGGQPAALPPLAAAAARHPELESLDARHGRREKWAARGLARLQVGRSEIDLGALEQLVESGQTRAIADALAWLQQRARRGVAPPAVESVAQLLDAYEAALAAGGLDATSGWPAPDRARARRYELAAALNRYRGLRVRPAGGERPRPTTTPSRRRPPAAGLALGLLVARVVCRWWSLLLAFLVLPLAAAPGGLAGGTAAAAAAGDRAAFWSEPAHCTTGPQHPDNHVFVFREGFWGPRDDDRNRHGALHCRGLDGGPRRFASAGDSVGTMGPNTAGSFYLGEGHLVAGKIAFEMRVPTAAAIPDHPAGVSQKDYLFRPAMSCRACRARRVWRGGANQGGSHYFRLGNGLGGEVDRLSVDFDAIEYGSIRAVILNRNGGLRLEPQPVHRYRVPALQPDRWVRFEISWRMERVESPGGHGGWNALELTVNGETHSFRLLDDSCPIGRMMQIGNVDRRFWNEARTGVMEGRTCTSARKRAALPAECQPTRRAAPFPPIEFRCLGLYVPRLPE